MQWSAPVIPISLLQMFDKTSEFARLEPETLQEEVLSEPESLKLTLEFIVLFLLGLAC